MYIEPDYMHACSMATIVFKQYTSDPLLDVYSKDLVILR